MCHSEIKWKLRLLQVNWQLLEAELTHAVVL